MDIFLAVAGSFFAIYGVIQMIAKGLFSHRVSLHDKTDVTAHRVIRIKNCEDSIEGIIRSIALEDIREKIIVIDAGSTDDTQRILERLAQEYEFLLLMTQDEYIDYINTID